MTQSKPSCEGWPIPSTGKPLAWRTLGAWNFFNVFSLSTQVLLSLTRKYLPCNVEKDINIFQLFTMNNLKLLEHISIKQYYIHIQTFRSRFINFVFCIFCNSTNLIVDSKSLSRKKNNKIIPTKNKSLKENPVLPLGEGVPSCPQPCSP